MYVFMHVPVDSVIALAACGVLRIWWSGKGNMAAAFTELTV